MPTSKEWLGIFNSALLEMLQSYNYEQVNDTDMTIEETIAVVDEILNEYFATQECTDEGACLQPDGGRVIRLNSSGHFEQLSNGSWIPPTDEYTVPPVPERTEPTAYSRRCAAAANAANVLKQTYEVATDAIEDGLSNEEVAAAIAAFLLTTIGAWLALAFISILGLIAALFIAFIEIAQFMTADLWNSEFDAMLTCLLYDCSTDTGDVVTFDLECFNTNYAATVDLGNPDALDQLRLYGQVWFMLSVIGADGLNAAGATTAITDADCSTCVEAGWCRQMLSSDGVEFVDMVIGSINVDDWIVADSPVGGQYMARFKVDLADDCHLNSVYYRIVNNGGFPRVTIMHNATAWDGISSDYLATYVAGDDFHTFTGLDVSGGYLGIQINANSPSQTLMNDLILRSDEIGAVNPFEESNCE